MSTQTTTHIEDLVLYNVVDGIAVLELNDPPANTYTYEMMTRLDHCILQARMDENVHVILLTGHGDKFFSAGANIKMLASVTPRFKYFFCLHANETLNRLEQTPKLVIAALNGHCVGGGMEIAMAADIRVARADAGKIGLPEVNLGIIPGYGGTQRLIQYIGKSRAIELLMTGDMINAGEAYRLGLVNYVVPPGEEIAKAAELIRRIAAKGPVAIAKIIECVNAYFQYDEDGFAREVRAFGATTGTEDFKEGAAAFIEKRKPAFRGE